MCLDTLGYPSDSRRRAGGFEISILSCSGRLRRRRSNAAWLPWWGKPCSRSLRVSGLGWLHRSVAGWRIALNTYSVLLWRCSSDLRDISQSYCVSRRRQAGSTGQQSPGRRIATDGPSESVVSDRMAARARQLIRLAPGRGRGRQVAG